MDAAAAGYLTSCILSYGLLSRLFVWIFARKDRSLPRVGAIHCFVLAALLYTMRNEPLGIAGFIAGALVWGGFDLWRASKAPAGPLPRP